jgi:hypothetical protein
MEREDIEIEVDERKSMREGAKARTPANQIDPASSVLADFEAALRIYEAVRDKLCANPPTPAVTVVPVLSTATGEKVKSAFLNFNPTRLPTAVRQDPSYLAPGGDLKSAQKAIIQRSITARQSSTVPHAMRVSLSSAEVAQLIGVTTSSTGITTGTMDLQDLMARIEARIGGGALYTAPAFATSGIDAEAEKRLNNITSGAAADPLAKKAGV